MDPVVDPLILSDSKQHLQPWPDSSTEAPDGKRRRRRNRIACDECHFRRVRCDRAFPCSRCLQSGVHCQFTRERRKRGRVPRKQQVIVDTGRETTASPLLHEAEVAVGDAVGDGQPFLPKLRRPTMEEGTSGTHITPDSYTPATSTTMITPPQPIPPPPAANVDDNLWSQSTEKTLPHGRLLLSPRTTTTTTQVPLKYPVLRPLVPFLEGHVPITRRLAFDLLELYFTSAFSTHMHPVCHHVHGCILRKASFLSQDPPRPTRPALLASMLWVASLDHRAFALSIPTGQRKRVRQFLCELTIRLLRPLVHVSSSNDQDGFAELGLGPSPEETFDDWGLIGPAGELDDVIAYIHVASVVSASEQKAASMRW